MKSCLHTSRARSVCHPEWSAAKSKDLTFYSRGVSTHSTLLTARLSLNMIKTMYRTHDCNSLRKTDVGKQVTLAGWVHVSRDHGGVIFVDLRDREGLTQVVFRPEENAAVAKQAHSLHSEDVIQVTGKVAARVPGTENPKLATGDIEVVPNELRVLNRAEDLPFQLDVEIHN